VEKELAKVEKDDVGATRYGIELSTRMCEGLLKAGVPGLHFYALNRAASVTSILSNLHLG
jgi:methylenetetrahydrofolate reductase (NADPH)